MQFTTIQDLFIKGSISHQINRIDWEKINTLSSSHLSAEDKLMIKRIRHSVRRGWINVFS
jgi:hypothetical protein